MGLAPITTIGACPIFRIQGVARDMTNCPGFVGVFKDRLTLSKWETPLAFEKPNPWTGG
jgi:hypothetical protein